MPRLYPPSPRFPPDDGGAEHAVWCALADQLPDDVALFHGLRIQEAAHEHELDLLIAWPGVGLAAIEVKGGHITRDGTAVGLVDTSGEWFSGRVSGRVVDHLVLDRGELAEAALAAPAVVGLFDPGHDCQAQLVAVAQRWWFKTFFCSRAK